MAQEIVTKFYAKAVGSDYGADRIVSLRASTTVPISASGPYMQALTSAITLLDTISVISGQLWGVYLHAVTSGVYYNPIGTAVVTAACCFISQGNFNYFTVQAGMSVVNGIRAQTSTATVEIWQYST